MRFTQVTDQLTHLYDLVRVKTYRRLIQDQDLRISHHCSRHTDSLLVTLGQMADQSLRHIHDLGPVHDLIDHDITLVTSHLFELRNEI